MASKINGLDVRPITTPDVSAVARVKSTLQGRTNDADDAGGVEITESARQLAALEEHVKGLPEVDEARVAEIRQAIEEGRYTVDPEATATRLMVFEYDLASLGS